MKLSRLTLRFLILFIVGGFLGGCIVIPPPVEDFTLARAALEAARSVDAARYSSGYFHQAEQAYRRAVQFYEDRDYEAAKAEFEKSRLTAEKAENSTRLIRFKNGEVL